MTRWKAASIHFLISLAVLGSLVALVLWRWYPPALFGMAKAGPLLGMIGAIDLVLGPLLTLVIYRAGKRGLKFDLTVIALVQMAALAYGLWTLWQSRPVYVVAVEDRFRLVFANEVDAASAARAIPRFQRMPALGPEWVAAPLPDEPRERLAAMLDAMNGLDIHMRPDRFQPYPHAKLPQLLAHAVGERDVLTRSPPDARRAWADAFADHPGTVMVPLGSSRGSAAVLVAPATGEVRALVPLDPWPIIDAGK